MYIAYIGAPFDDIGNIWLYSLKWQLLGLALSAGITLLFFRDSFYRLSELLENERIDKIWKGILFIPLIAAAFYIWAKPLDLRNVNIGRVRMISLILFPVVLLVYHLIIYLLWWTTKHITKESDLKRRNDLLQIEEKRYEELRYYSEQASVIRHDFRHHLSVIGELLNPGKTDEARDYIRQFTDTDETEHKPFCQNREIDAIAAHYDKIARKQGIRISWHLDLGEKLPFRAPDICSVTGNLLENAINAVKDLGKEKRTVDITMKMRTGQMLALFIRNPYENEIVYDKNGLPAATKPGHGIGLRSVVSIVKSHYGDVKIGTGNGCFEVSVIMFEKMTGK